MNIGGNMIISPKWVELT